MFVNSRNVALAAVLIACAAVWAEKPDVSGYVASAKVTVAGVAGDAALTDFPVLVRLSKNITGFTYNPFKLENGGDLIFTDAEGNELASEVDTWNPDGESLVWVKLPTLDSNGATLNMYYGNADAAKTLAASDVWTAFAVVWHLNDDATDSTGHGLAQTTRGSNVSAVANGNNLGRAFKLTGAKNGSAVILANPKDYCTAVSDTSSSVLLTVSGWFKPYSESVSSTSRLICWKKGSGDTTGIDFVANASNGKNFLMVRGSGDTKSATPKYNLPWTKDTWTHLVAVYGDKVGYAYCDGAACSFYTSGTTIPVTKVGTVGVGLGNMGEGSTENYGISGVVDELRFYNGVASEAWIKAEHDTVTSASFAVVSDVTISDTFVELDGAPTVTRTDDATVEFSAALTSASSAADIYAIATDVATGVAVTNLLQKAVAAGGSATGTLTGLASDKTYSFSAYAVGTAESVSETTSTVRFYLGTPGANRYVSTSGDDRSDGYSAASPKATISAAVATVASTGGTVFIGDGTYLEETEASSLAFATPIVLEGVSKDPTKVTIKRTQKLGRILRLANANAGARYVTLANGGYDNTKYGYQGGNVYITADGGFLEDCIVEGGSCGAAYAEMAYGANVAMDAGRITRCIIRNGQLGNASYYGSGLGARGEAIAEDCLIVDNNGQTDYSAGHTHAGAVYLYGNAKLVNCTIANNWGSVNSGIFFASDTARVINCAIFGNRTGSDRAADLAGGVYNSADFTNCFDHCAAAVALNDTCLVSSAPGFTDAANGNYTLDASSPLVDAGCDVASIVTSATDLAGGTRVLYGAVDIGCYERVRAAFEAGYTASRSIAFMPDAADVTFTAVASPSNGVTYSWDFGDGSDVVATTEPVITHTYASCGTVETRGYMTVRLTATRGDASVEYTSPVPLRVVPRTVYVNADATNATYPYDSPEKACTKIATGTGFGADGMVFVLAAGSNYYEGVVVTNAITLRGATGNAADVVVKNGGRNLYVSHSGAMVRDITFADGFGSYAAGGNLWLGSGVVSNCVLTGGRVDSNGGDGAGAYVAGGRLTHCIIQDSKGGNRTTGVFISQVGGLVDNCLMRNSRDSFVATKNSMRLASVKGGTMANCTIVGGVVIAGGQDATDAGYTQQGSVDDVGLKVDVNGTAINCVVADLRFANTTAKKPIAISGVADQIINCVCDDPLSAEYATTGTVARIFTDYGFKGTTNLVPVAGGLLYDKGTNYVWTASDTDLSGSKRVFGKATDIGCYESQKSLGFRVIVR